MCAGIILSFTELYEAMHIKEAKHQIKFDKKNVILWSRVTLCFCTGVGHTGGGLFLF